eukprot:165421-Amphidinium_carterae.2
MVCENCDCLGSRVNVVVDDSWTVPSSSLLVLLVVLAALVLVVVGVVSKLLRQAFYTAAFGEDRRLQLLVSRKFMFVTWMTSLTVALIA